MLVIAYQWRRPPATRLRARCEVQPTRRRLLNFWLIFMYDPKSPDRNRRHPSHQAIAFLDHRSSPSSSVDHELPSIPP